jgi:hypothetical protein
VHVRCTEEKKNKDKTIGSRYNSSSKSKS